MAIQNQVLTPQEPSFFEIVFGRWNIFVMGVAIGAFLTYHYFVVKRADTTVRRSLGSLKENGDDGKGPNGNWRDSNPEHITDLSQPRHSTSGRRRSSILYH